MRARQVLLVAVLGMGCATTPLTPPPPVAAVSCDTVREELRLAPNGDVTRFQTFYAVLPFTGVAQDNPHVTAVLCEEECVGEQWGADCNPDPCPLGTKCQYSGFQVPPLAERCVGALPTIGNGKIIVSCGSAIHIQYVDPKNEPYDQVHRWRTAMVRLSF